jgi:hypothetical protein
LSLDSAKLNYPATTKKNEGSNILAALEIQNMAYM